jgi:hypothetical protein
LISRMMFGVAKTINIYEQIVYTKYAIIGLKCY